MQANQGEQTLTNLGLTLSQAKVYLALIHNGPSKVSAISQATGIHRAHLYEILRSLETEGLVDRNLSEGVFTAAPIKEAAPLLIKQKKEEVENLEKQVKAIEDFAGHAEKLHEEKFGIVLTSNKNRTLNRGQKYFKAAKTQIDSMQSWKRFVQFYEHYENQMLQIMKKGVHIRQLVEFPNNSAQAREFLKRKVFRDKNFELRFVAKTGGNFNLIDQCMLLMSTTVEKESLAETPVIFSNYEGLIGLMDNYFKLAWATGAPAPQAECQLTQPDLAKPVLA